MKIPEKLLEVLKYEGVVAIVTQNESNPHVVNTWNTYLQITQDEKILIPVGGMKTTEEYIKKNKHVLVTLGTREVQGFNSMGTGFLIAANADFLYSGDNFNLVKTKFSWARAALEITPLTIKQTL